MRILWVATKSPVPPSDGGRLVALTTLQALAAAGHDVTVVAPVAATSVQDVRRAARIAGLTIDPIAATPRSWSWSAVIALARGLPVTIARHDHGALRARVDAVLAAGGVDVVHAEQVQALAACDGARRHGVPVVLRAQNVESDVWSGRAGLRLEARRLARFEGRAVRGAAATVALTARDADRLRTLGGGAARVVHVPAPFPAELPPGPPLPGDPAVALPGSAGWALNDDARAWFTHAVWPTIVAGRPAARLHVFGGARPRDAGPTITHHPAAAESRDAFPAGALVVVPLRRAAGVRMRILEAWARRLPVVATTAAAAGLDGAADALLAADDPAALAAAVVMLAADPVRRAACVAAGTAVLRARHDPATIAAELAAVYRSAVPSAARARS